MHVLQILPDGLLTMTRARVFSVHRKQTPKHAFGGKKNTLKSVRRSCHMTGAESRGSLARSGLHSAKPELSCTPGSPSSSHQNSLLDNKAPARQWGTSSQSSSSQCSFPVPCVSPTLLTGQQGRRTVGIQVWYQQILLEKKAIST